MRASVIYSGPPLGSVTVSIPRTYIQHVETVARAVPYGRKDHNPFKLNRDHTVSFLREHSLEAGPLEYLERILFRCGIHLVRGFFHKR